MIKKNKSFDQKIYSGLSVGSLILFTIHSLTGKKEYSFAELVAKSFDFFPEIFSLDAFPHWPDSRKLDRPLRELRSKGMIKGDLQSGISLSVKGKQKALEIMKMFGQSKLKI